MKNTFHLFGNKDIFEIKYLTLYDQFGNNPEFKNKYKKIDCDGELYFIVKGKNLFENKATNGIA